ncbi:MAG TPA: DinB family protein [Balneolales bacterium]|nr:DinB family protein [Balneolales bacterium]
MIQYFTRLFRYDKWACENVINAIFENNIDDERLQSLMSHIIDIEQMWFERIDQGKSEIDMQKLIPPDQWNDQLLNINDKYRNLLKSVDEVELDRKRDYVNSKGVPHHIPLRDLLTHVLNHSTHHRAQMTFRIRKLGYEPPLTDYIFYLYQL